MIRKVSDSGEDLYLALQVYRSTPLEHGVSPAELLFNRKIKSNLPIKPILLNPKLVGKEPLKKKIKLKQRQKKNFDQTSTPMEPLQVGDTVRVQKMDKLTSNRPLWSKAGVINKVLPNRSYMVKTETGEIIRRNRKHLLKTQPTTTTIESDEEEEDKQTPQVTTQSQNQPDSSSTQMLRRSERVTKPNLKYFNNSYTT